jgi:hypothetical protein
LFDFDDMKPCAKLPGGDGALAAARAVNVVNVARAARRSLVTWRGLAQGKWHLVPIKISAAAALLMSCWVAPTLAAEIWQIPLEQLMRRIESGEIPARREDGFTFVDVAPYGPRVERPNRAPQDRPAMCVPIGDDDHDDELQVRITDEETAALVTIDSAKKDDDDAADFSEMGPADDTASVTLGDWRSARRKAGRTRIPPPPPRRLSA